MTKITYLLSLMGLLLLTGNALSMDTQNTKTLCKPLKTGLAPKSQASTYDSLTVEHTNEILYLLRQQLSQARIEQQPLPAYFFAELTSHLQTVSHANNKLRYELGKILEAAQSINDELLPVVMDVAEDEIFDEESL